MSEKRDFENILDECLTRIQRGESIESCLAAYPGQSAELEPLLRTAMVARRAAAIQPRREFREKAALEFQAAIREMPTKATGWGTPWRRRLLEAVAGVVFVLLAGTGLVAASSSSLPDEPLYAVKTATENAWLALTPSDIGKARLYVKFTDRRVDEIVAMAAKSQVAPLEKATQRLDSQMVAMAGLTARNEATSATGFAKREVTSPPSLAAPRPTTTVAGTTTSSTTTAAPSTTAAMSPPDTAATTTTAPPPQAVTDGSGKGFGSEAAPPSHDQGLYEEEQSEEAELRDILARSAAANSMALREELDNAPESVRPALEKAIEVASSGYEQNLSNLGY